MAEEKKTTPKRTTARRGTSKKKDTKKKLLKVTLVRGLAGKRKTHVKAVKSLGLRRPHQSRVLEDNPMVRGNIKKAHYLIKVEEITDEAS